MISIRSSFVVSLIRIDFMIFYSSTILNKGKNKPMTPTYEELLIKLEGIPNARQLGGYINQHGQKIKNNVLLRSGSLCKATEKDLEYLAKNIGIKLVFDFRSDREINSKPDKDIPGAENINLDLLLHINNETIKKIFMDKEEDEKDEHPVIHMCRNNVLIEYMTNLYSKLVQDTHAHSLYNQMFKRVLASGGVPFLWHCAYGKDRTGIAALLILAALEVDMATIREDFLRTNIAYKKNIDMLIKMAKDENFTENQIWTVKSMVGVAEESFDSGIKIINEKYGGVQNYLRNQIGLTEEDIIKFREYYLEK